MRGKPRQEVVKQAQETAPPIPAAEALRRNLLYATYKGLKTDNMQALVEMLETRALQGDLKAATLLLSHLRAGGPPAPASQDTYQSLTLNMSADPKFMSELREQLVCVLAKMGGLHTTALVEHTHQSRPLLLEALCDHPWFVNGPEGWYVTATAREQVLGKKQGG